MPVIGMDAFSDEEDLSDLDDDQPIIGLNTRKGQAQSSDEEEEVYGLLSGDESSNDDEADDVAEDIKSDIEDEENDGLPDSRAWGRKRKNFYDGDFVDANNYGKDPEAAQLEEQEARDIQERLAEQLDAGTSFSLEMLASQMGQDAEGEKQLEKADDVPEVDEKIVTDLSKLSKRQQLELMKKESPEFFGLVNDFKEKMAEAKEKWLPMMKLISEGKVKSPIVEQFVHTNYELILNYCTHIGFYLLLKSKKISVRTHPVIKRLCQLQELIKSLSDANESLSMQVYAILNAAAENRNVNLLSSDDTDKVISKNDRTMKKLLGILGKKVEMDASMDDSDDEGVGAFNIRTQEEGEKKSKVKKDVVSSSALKGAGGRGGRGSKHVSFGDEDMDGGDDDDGDMADLAEGGVDGEGVGAEEDEGGKRAITYQMAKNKGLTPRRKKEMRNPRVKHRNRFRKAKIRRKGQVREVYSETSRYGGEISGIKATTSKSIKIK
ncbi:something about silencing protein 10 [Ischnura elegans]|uniref:something about silencing protein 10 n=1 Tax=Ischnura elegans TaxID=197161 RepID=UPI001ED8747E|nr:something about silencing protein 10 [Ischnura elegans]